MTQPQLHFLKHSQPHRLRKVAGFTFIELVLVLVLLGILGAIAVPRFVGAGDSKSLTTRDALLSRLRLVQTMNMNEPLTQRTRLSIDKGTFSYITELDNGSGEVGRADITGSNAGWRRVYTSDVTILLSGRKGQRYSLAFDRLGLPQMYNRKGEAKNKCKTGCEILVGSGKYKIIIEREGYIHAP